MHELTNMPVASTRRLLLSRVSSVVMGLGLTAGYGMFAAMMGWFVYPFRPSTKSWQFVTDLAGFELGQSIAYESPAGQHVVVTRLGGDGTSDDFIALSSVCPHLGCRVHWESHNNRFFCPCHNGVFDRAGNPLAGPPNDAGQALSPYPLKIEGGLLFIKVPTSSLV